MSRSLLPQKTSSFNSDGNNTPFSVENRNGSGEETAHYTSALAEQERQLQQSKHHRSKKAARRGAADSTSHVIPYQPEFGDSAGERRNGRDMPQEKHVEMAKDAMGKGMKTREDPGRRRRRPSSVEVFMSRLEGNRGVKNRRESIEAFKRLLQDCPTNNSAQFRDDAALEPNSGIDSSDGGEPARAKASALQSVLNRRQEAHKAVAEVMSPGRGSYMLGRVADESKILLGRRKPGRTPKVGVVRVAASQM